MLQAFVTDQVMNVLSIKFGEAREGGNESRDGAENFIGDGSALGRGFFRVREFQVAHRGSAQSRHCEIEQGYVEAGEAERCMRQRPQQEFGYSIHPPPSTRSPS